MAYLLTVICGSTIQRFVYVEWSLIKKVLGAWCIKNDFSVYHWFNKYLLRHHQAQVSWHKAFPRTDLDHHLVNWLEHKRSKIWYDLLLQLLSWHLRNSQLGSFPEGLEELEGLKYLLE